ncbi:MAG: rhodanese-like domain-containing protein [Desulfuromonadaceae bacterium]|nr:rhodanese-like domain-containing protein [Desulfuromonadaceae bacterium]
MFFEKIRSEGLSQLSYILGDEGRAAVIDPRRDCDIYRQIADREGCRITHIFETHRNEDFVVGSCELMEQTGAEVYHGAALPFKYGNPVTEGERFNFGNFSVQILKTPGHTDESISLVLSDMEFSEQPLAIFTGDALFIGDVGRTDFYPERAKEVAGLLYDSIFDKILPLGDHVLLYPAHGAGSVCGSGMASREFSSLGYERCFNPALQVKDRSEFIHNKISEIHYYPPYFREMEKLNLAGPHLLGKLPWPKPFSADEFAAAMAEGMLALDIRSPEAISGASITDSLAIPLEMLTAYVGWFVPHEQKIGLIVQNFADIKPALRSLVRIGYENLVAYLDEGLHGWEISGRRYERIPSLFAGDLKQWQEDGKEFTLLDVRKQDEVERGQLTGSTHIYLGELPKKIDEIPPERPIVTFCGSGMRAIIASSLLKRRGFEQVETCLGSMKACQAVGCPIKS